jgi:glycosyltransferase involved in cell wall biosynthesis
MESLKYSQRHPPKVIAAFPAYNEEKYIGSLVLKTRQLVDEVIVVDDGSSDQTGEIARLAGATVIRHDGNKGKGAAIQTILAEAKRIAPDVLVLLDADSQHNPEEIPRLIQPIGEGSDLVIGSRALQRRKIPFYRRIGQKVLLHSTELLSGQALTDSESGFRALSPRAIAELKLSQSGFAIETEMIAVAAKKGLKITEVPISAIYTKDGSTMNPVRHGFGVLAQILAMISESKPLFFFGTSGSILAALGLAAGVRTVNIFTVHGIIPTGTALLSVLLLTIGMFSIFTGIILHTLARRKG